MCCDLLTNTVLRRVQLVQIPNPSKCIAYPDTPYYARCTVCCLEIHCSAWPKFLTWCPLLSYSRGLAPWNLHNSSGNCIGYQERAVETSSPCRCMQTNRLLKFWGPRKLSRAISLHETQKCMNHPQHATSIHSYKQIYISLLQSSCAVIP